MLYFRVNRDGRLLALRNRMWVALRRQKEKRAVSDRGRGLGPGLVAGVQRPSESIVYSVARIEDAKATEKKMKKLLE